MGKKHSKHILVACNHLVSVGGSELYSYYLIKALKSRGCYNVEYFTHHGGEISEKIERDLGVGPKSRNRYDLILASHNTTVNYLFGQGPIIQVCHGPIPDIEQPSPLANYHIAVSDEIALHLSDKGFPSTVILNGVDMDVFKPIKPLSQKPVTILSLCQSEEANELIASVCQAEGIGFRSINKHKNPQFQLAGEINEVDLVIGIGRSAYDAMACGRPCVLFDMRSYNGSLGDGYLYPERFNDFVKYNCSGRYSKKTFNKEGLKAEIHKYNPNHGKELRQIAFKELNLAQNADRILEVGFGISAWNHLKHRVKVSVDKEVNRIFMEQKRFFRGKMKGAADNGESLMNLLRMIGKERFPWRISISLYAYWFKLFTKNASSRKKDN